MEYVSYSEFRRLCKMQEAENQARSQALRRVLPKYKELRNAKRDSMGEYETCEFCGGTAFEPSTGRCASCQVEGDVLVYVLPDTSLQ